MPKSPDLTLPLAQPITLTRYSSGPNLTFESREGFPRFWAHASLAHAHRDFHHHYRLSTASAQGDCRRSERTAEACLAGTDRASVGGPRRHGRNHASDGEVQDLCLALARTGEAWGVSRGRAVRGPTPGQGDDRT